MSTNGENASGEAFVDYYTILEVSPNADQATIRTSYMRLAKLRHPDRNRENPDATVLFQLLQNAYSVLADPKTRRAFDRRRQRTQWTQGTWGNGSWGNGTTFRRTWTMGSQAQPQTQSQQSTAQTPAGTASATFSATTSSSSSMPQASKEENERSHREFRQQREEAFRRVFQGTPMRPQEDNIFRIDRTEREARMKESAARMKEAAARLRESAYRFKEERERKARQDSDWNAENEAFIKAEIKIMQLD